MAVLNMGNIFFQTTELVNVIDNETILVLKLLLITLCSDTNVTCIELSFTAALQITVKLISCHIKKYIAF